MNFSYRKIIFVIRLTAIGDVILCTKTLGQLVSNGYFPILVTSHDMLDVVQRIPFLSTFLLFDKNKKTLFFQNQQVCSKEEFKNTFFLNTSQILLLDLQKTKRSKRATHYLKKNFAIEKSYMVPKRTLFRFFLIFFAWFSWTQKKQISPFFHFTRIADLQKKVLHKIGCQKPSNWKYTLVAKNSAPLHPYLCFFPGASGKTKMWPMEKWKNLTKKILEETSLQIYFCGGKNEEHLETHLEVLQNIRIHNKIGKITLGDTLDLIAGSRYIVTNDSFAAHAADAFQVPATVLFGGTTPLFGFVPEFDKIQIQYAHLNCSPCTRHGKNPCRFQNLQCMELLSEQDIFIHLKGAIL